MSRRKYLDPDAVPPLAGSRLYADLGIFHYMSSLCLLFAFLKLLTVFDLYHSRDHVPRYTRSRIFLTPILEFALFLC
jgi:hypothetical protein